MEESISTESAAILSTANNVSRPSRETAASGGSSRQRTGVQNLPPGYEVMKFMIPSLLVTALLMYQLKPDRFITENPASISCFFLFTSIYWLIVRKIKQMLHQNDSDASHTKCLRILGQIARVSEVVSSFSLLSIILQNQLPFMRRLFWILMGVGVAWLIFYSTYICLGLRINIAVLWLTRGELAQATAPSVAVSTATPQPIAQPDHIITPIPEFIEENTPLTTTIQPTVQPDSIIIQIPEFIEENTPLATTTPPPIAQPDRIIIQIPGFQEVKAPAATVSGATLDIAGGKVIAAADTSIK